MNSKEINYELEKNMEVISQLDDFVGHAVDTVLVDPEDCWQPSDFLPDFANPEAMEDVKLLQQRASGIPDTVFNSTEFHVADFEVTDAGDYILLV